MNDPEPRSLALAAHRLLPDPPTAYGVALALAETFRPGRYVTYDGGYDVLDSAMLTADIAVMSTGEGVMLSIIRSLAGAGMVDLSRMDALDRAGAALIAEALALLARR
jgi:dihydroxyacetone kinase-like predicted kinase